MCVATRREDGFIANKISSAHVLCSPLIGSPSVPAILWIDGIVLPWYHSLFSGSVISGFRQICVKFIKSVVLLPMYFAIVTAVSFALHVNEISHFRSKRISPWTQNKTSENSLYSVVQQEGNHFLQEFLYNYLKLLTFCLNSLLSFFFQMYF